MIHNWIIVTNAQKKRHSREVSWCMKERVCWCTGEWLSRWAGVMVGWGLGEGKVHWCEGGKGVTFGLLVISWKSVLSWLLSSSEVARTASALSEAGEPLPSHNGFCCFLQEEQKRRWTTLLITLTLNPENNYNDTFADFFCLSFFSFLGFCFIDGFVFFIGGPSPANRPPWCNSASH